MTTEFTVSGVIDVLAQSFFEGNTTLAGIAIMLVLFFIMVVILANVHAPVSYSLVPIMLIAVFFSYIGVMETTISFIIIILSVVMIALAARRVTE